MEEQEKSGKRNPGGNDQVSELHLENEILKLKMQAEFGACFGSAKDLDPEIEHQFLQHIIAFEEAAKNAKPVKVYELIGQPSFQLFDQLQPGEVGTELDRLLKIMEDHQVLLDVLGEYPDEVIYRFITEEFFEHETQAMHVPGMTSNFVYEEFHPNHQMDIRQRTMDFLGDWFEQRMGEYSWELGEEFILPDEVVITRSELIKKVNAIFESYTGFINCKYAIGDISFQWNEKEETGMGYAEGGVKYDASLENGEQVHIEGPFKLYLKCSYGWWTIFYFVFPGFKW